MSSYTFRPATPDDAADLLEIYAPYVRETAISFEYEVPSESEFRERIEKISERFPYIVALSDEGGKKTVCGYAYGGVFHAREAYKHCTEISIYLRSGMRGKGLGAELYRELERALFERGFTTVYAGIAATRRNPDEHLTEASIRFHTKMGFHHAALMRHCGLKFGKWYDLVYMEKQLVNIEEKNQASEIFDIYTEDRFPTGKTAVRGKNTRGELHLIVHVCIFNSKGQMLIQKRSGSKSKDPGLWDLSVAGHVDSGETSREGAGREMMEELGLSLQISERPYFTINFDHGFDDYYILDRDLVLEDLRLQESEVESVMWADCRTIHEMIDGGTFIPYHHPLIDLIFSSRGHRGSHLQSSVVSMC